MRCIAANPWNSRRGRAAIWSRIFILQLRAPSCVCLCFCSSPASCSAVASTRPPSSRQSRGTQPRCHSAAQAPQRLRFPLGLTEVFAVFHIVGIQHQPVYWSPCGSSLSPPPPPPFFVHVFPPFHNIPSLYGVCILLLHKVRTQHTYELEFLPILDDPLMWRKSHWSVWGWVVAFILYYKNNHVFRWINNFISLKQRQYTINMGFLDIHTWKAGISGVRAKYLGMWRDTGDVALS